MLEEEKSAAKKRVHIYKEDDTTIALFKTSDYITGTVNNTSSNSSIDIDCSISIST